MNRTCRRARLITIACFTMCAFAQSPLEHAVTLARERNYKEARQVLQDVPEPSALSQRIAFHRLKAAVAAGLGNSAEAALEMRQALKLAPGDADLSLGAAVVEFQAGETDSALQHASSAGRNASAKELLGDIQELRGMFPEAIAAYREAVELDPSKEEYRVALAFHLIRHQFFSPAISGLGVDLLRFPRSIRLRTLLGIAQFATAEVEMAVESLSDAIALDSAVQPAEPAYRCLAQIVLQSSKAPEARVMTQLCSWNTTVCSALKLRFAREQQDAAMQAEATAGLERAASLPETTKGERAIARCELARAREWSGRLPEARVEMEACVAADSSPQNHYRLALIYGRLGLTALAQTEIALRNQILKGMSEQTANGLNVLKSLP